MRFEDFLGRSGRELRQALDAGHPVRPEDLDDSRYLGVSVGLPRWIEALSWKTFIKTFHRDPDTGVLRGWNVRIEQTGWEGEPTPKTRRGGPFTFGHYRVVGGEGARRPPPAGALLLDYGLGGNAPWDVMGVLRDPIVALEPGSAEWLLGGSWVDLGIGSFWTPAWFVLRRIGILDHLVESSFKTGAP